MGRHVAGEMPELERLVDGACAEIGREIASLRVPRLAGVVLGGGYGRGEGGAESVELKTENGELKIENALSNDLDFFAITEDGAPEAEAVAAIGKALEPVSKRWSEKLGVDVDFAVKTPWRLKHDEERLMVQELVRGYCDVSGAKGETLFAGIERRPAESVPWMEAARLLMNRGRGLLLAKCRSESAERKIDGSSAVGRRLSGAELDFVNRNINKCVLGAGDARLVARHAYSWRAEERAAALGDALYSAAVEWKFRPKEEAVCGWDEARDAWLAALGEVGGCGAGEKARNLRNAARWIVRRRTVGDLRTLGLDPVVRVLGNVERRVRARRAPDGALMRDWEIFN